MRVNVLFVILFAVGCIAPASNDVFAHCDTLDGPVVKDAQIALETGDVTPALKWVKKEDEPEIRAAFDKALLERKINKEAVDMEFYETLVRIHRAGEGAGFTGLVPAGAVEPAVAKADEAIEKGSVDELAEEIRDAVFNGIKERFEKVMEAKKHMNDSVEAGREYVEAYIEFVHYVEAIHNIASSGSAHHHEISQVE